jgi:REP element-mobilizing transposase RayT
MPWVKVWIHLVWSTKNREPYLTENIRKTVFQHIRENAQKKGIFLDFIGGYIDHIHCLISLGTEQSIKEIVQLIKGESSHWINTNRITPTKFAWQDEYFAVSVSETAIESVRRYIANQEEHHRKVGFTEEFDDFLTRAGFQRFKD